MNKSTLFSIVRRASLLTFAAVALTALSGCETSEDRALASGQTCLDNARTPADANQCIALVEGLTSSESYLIRCSANFVAQGFTGQRIANAFESLKDNSPGGTDPMVTMLAYLNFDNGLTLHTAEKAVENCEKSGVRSMLRLATAAQLATTISDIGNVAVDPDSLTAVADMLQAVQDAVGKGGDAAIGNIAIIANQAYCNAGSSFESNEVCVNLQAAVNGGGSAATIGAALLAALQSNSGS